MTDILKAALPAAILVLIWVAAYVVVIVSTRPAAVDPDPAGQELPGAEPPAVVNLLVNHWRVTEDAAEATLLDLAAGGWIEFRQPAADPMETTVHLRPDPVVGQGLHPYEKQVLNRVRKVAHDGVAPIRALGFRDRSSARAWSRRFERAVLDQTRAAGLSRNRYPRALRVVLTLGAVIPAAALSALVEDDGSHRLVAGAYCFAAFSVLVAALRGERDGPAGRAAARRWLGLQAFLRDDEAFAQLPAAAVPVWGRYLAYGAALGTTPAASHVLDLGLSDRSRVWSSFTGRWRLVRISYPRLGTHYCSPMSRILSFAGIEALIATMVGTGSLVVLLGSSGLGPRPTGPATAVLVVCVLVMIRAVYRIVRCLQDWARPITLSGEVIYLDTWNLKEKSQRLANQHLALDDGHSDRIQAWELPGELRGSVRTGDLVQIVVRPWSRRILTVTPSAERAVRGG